MCNLCSINQHIDDELDDEFDEQPALCMHQANHINAGEQLQQQTFEPAKPILSGSSF